MNGNPAPIFGVSLFETLNDIYEEEFKFKRVEPQIIVFPRISRRNTLFLEAFFGALPKDVSDVINKNFGSKLQIQAPRVSIKEFYRFLAQDQLFLRRISRWKIKALRHRAWRGNIDCIFLLDATNTLDVIDYWNLMAIGWNIVPIPVQVIAEEGLRKIAETFIEENHFAYGYGNKVYNQTTILVSWGVSEQTLSQFTKSLNLTPAEGKHNYKYSVQRWRPRVWDGHVRELDGAECCNLTVESRNDSVGNMLDGHIAVPTIDPPMQLLDFFSGRPRFANEISFGSCGRHQTDFAEVLPNGGLELIREIGAIGLNEWRISAKGVVYFSPWANGRIAMKVPSAEAVFISWLKLHGWDASLSSSGRIAKQMLEQVGGTWGSSILASPGLIEYLSDDMAEGKSELKDAVWGRIQKIVNTERLPADPASFLQRLTDQNIIRLGLEIQCPVCQRRSWHSLFALDYTIRCEKCLHDFAIPTHAPDDLKWAYRSQGPFSLKRDAKGAYAVLLTLRFFSEILNGATTPIMSFESKKDGKTLEVDLGLFYRQTSFEGGERELIFAECKTYNRFDEKDVRRMNLVADSFPGSIIVFSTLNENLTGPEIRLIKRITNKGQRHLRDDRLCNPVLVLTGTELFAKHDLRGAWKQRGGRHQDLAGRGLFRTDLLPLCALTQQLYLGMPS